MQVPKLPLRYPRTDAELRVWCADATSDINGVDLEAAKELYAFVSARPQAKRNTPLVRIVRALLRLTRR